MGLTCCCTPMTVHADVVRFMLMCESMERLKVLVRRDKAGSFARLQSRSAWQWVNERRAWGAESHSSASHAATPQSSLPGRLACHNRRSSPMNSAIDCDVYASLMWASVGAVAIAYATGQIRILPRQCFFRPADSCTNRGRETAPSLDWIGR